jgi:molybdopterin adenylyltransferase
MSPCGPGEGSKELKTGETGGGSLRGMTEVVEDHRRRAPASLGFAVLTVSDSRTAATDSGGDAAAERIAAAGHRVEARRLVRDEEEAVRQAVEELLAAPGVDVLVLTGGTGVAPRDVTVEAVSPLFEKPLPGFGELFRMLSHRQVGSAAMLSRAAAGVAAGRAVFLLPGSPKGVVLALDELILPEAGHLVSQARRPPGGVPAGT